MVLLMEQIKREKHTIIVNELKSNLSTFQGKITKGHVIVKTLIKKKEDRITRLDVAESKAQDLVVSKKNLKKSIGDALNSKKKMYDEMYSPKDEAVHTYDVYFEWANE